MSFRNVLLSVVQAVILFGTETWVLLESMDRNLEGVYVVFLSHITGQKVKQYRDGTWRSKAVYKVLKEAVTQSLGSYIYKQQTTVAEWVALRPMLEVSYKDTGYKGGGRRRDPWCQKMAAGKQLSDILKEISVAARVWRLKSGRRGEGGGGREVAESELDVGIDGPWYYGTDTGNAQMGE